MNLITGNSLWALVLQSDTISKCVLLILLGMSFVCWTLFIGKLFIFWMKEKQLKKVNRTMQHAQSVHDLEVIAQNNVNSTAAYFIHKTLVMLKEIGFSPMRPIASYQWELIEKNNQNLIDTILNHDESYLAILSSSAAVAPLLGLFGTVWGLVHSFIRISETQIADIATIAPGIAEALITTLAGLMVAIPALVMFHYLNTKTRALEYQLFILTDRVLFILHHLRERI
jgi:biopolymer transport protein ExbB/TolQ